jgi:hypothetical protein
MEAACPARQIAVDAPEVGIGVPVGPPGSGKGGGSLVM